MMLRGERTHLEHAHPKLAVLGAVLVAWVAAGYVHAVVDPAVVAVPVADDAFGLLHALVDADGHPGAHRQVLRVFPLEAPHRKPQASGGPNSDVPLRLGIDGYAQLHITIRMWRLL